MDIILFNTIWMAYNIFLAFVAIIFGFLMFRTKNIIGKIIFGFLWLLFIPNTVYMLTDVIHLKKQLFMTEHLIVKIIFLIQYSLLIFIGIITFIYALSFFEKTMLSILKKNFGNRRVIVFSILVTVNFLIALGVALGRFQRVNSWDVFINTEHVIVQTMLTISSLQIFIIAFGILSNIIYFTLKKKIMNKRFKILN